jgi:hypothetical protein
MIYDGNDLVKNKNHFSVTMSTVKAPCRFLNDQVFVIGGMTKDKFRFTG